MITEERLAEIEARANAATQGPWEMRTDQDNGQGSREQLLASNTGEWKVCDSFCIWTPPAATSRGKQRAPNEHEHKYDPTVLAGDGWHGSGDLIISDEDAAFIAAARTDVPQLVAEIRRLRDALRSTYRYHYAPEFGGYCWCRGERKNALDPHEDACIAARAALSQEPRT